ncbi:MAG: FUSC family protein [Burkholderiales bacterium]
MQLDLERLVRASRLSLAVSLGIIIAVVSDLPYAAWVPITITVVLFDQYTVGGTLNRGFLRIAATLSSALIGIILIIIFNNHPLVNNAAIVIVAFIYSYLFMDKKHSYIGLLGVITLIMVLIPSSKGILTPIFRALEISVGVIVAILAMLLFYPQYAKDKALKLLLNSLSKLEAITLVFTDPHYELVDFHQQFLALESEFISDIVKFNRLADEAKFETKSKPYIKPYTNIFLHLRRIYRLLNIIFYHASNLETRSNPQLQQDLWQIAKLLNQLRNQLQSDQLNLKQLDLTNVAAPPGDVSQLDQYKSLFIQTILSHIYAEIHPLIGELQQLNQH